MLLPDPLGIPRTEWESGQWTERAEPAHRGMLEKMLAARPEEALEGAVIFALARSAAPRVILDAFRRDPADPGGACGALRILADGGCCTGLATETLGDLAREVDEERAALSRQLHREVAGALTAAMFRLESCLAQAEKTPAAHNPGDTIWTRVQDEIARATVLVQQLAARTAPPITPALGLDAAIGAVCDIEFRSDQRFHLESWVGDPSRPERGTLAAVAALVRDAAAQVSSLAPPVEIPVRCRREADRLEFRIETTLACPERGRRQLGALEHSLLGARAIALNACIGLVISEGTRFELCGSIPLAPGAGSGASATNHADPRSP